jgi:hypothetical protein
MTTIIFDEEVCQHPNFYFNTLFETPGPSLLRSDIGPIDFCPEPPRKRKRIQFFIQPRQPPLNAFSLHAAATDYHHNKNLIANILRKCDEIMAQRHGTIPNTTDAVDIDPLDAYDALYLPVTP